MNFEQTVLDMTQQCLQSSRKTLSSLRCQPAARWWRSISVQTVARTDNRCSLVFSQYCRQRGGGQHLFWLPLKPRKDIDGCMTFLVCVPACAYLYALALGSYLSGLFLQVSDLVSNNRQFVTSVSFDKVVSLKHNFKRQLLQVCWLIRVR